MHGTDHCLGPEGEWLLSLFLGLLEVVEGCDLVRIRSEMDYNEYVVHGNWHSTLYVRS